MTGNPTRLNVIEGSLRAVGDNLRIAVRVIDGENGHHVGVERFDVPANENTSVTDEIVNCIVARLEPAQVNLSGLRVLRRKPENLDAWQNFERGFHVLMRRTPEDCAAAALLFDRAVALDEGLSSAHSMWAYAQLQQSFLSAQNLDPTILTQIEQRTELARSIDAPS